MSGQLNGRPLVSCVMPTRNRPRFAAQAIRYFLRQTYPNKEMIVVVDGTHLDDPAFSDPRVRVIEVPDQRTIGEKRNIGCTFAAGEIIVQWDDDDWYGPARLESQARPLLETQADITGLTCDALLDVETSEYLAGPREEHDLVFGQVASGTLAFKTDVWTSLARYPHQNRAEDVSFLHDAVGRGARLEAVYGLGLFMYVLHNDNVWANTLDTSTWHRITPPIGLNDRLFYRGLARGRRPDRRLPPRRAATNGPLVSCIMPTADRLGFVPLALRCFQRQEYKNRELIVIDDGRSSVERLVTALPKTKYIRVEPGMSLGQKRNMACELATGSFICHWDDDDWFSPQRLGYQMSQLLHGRAKVCGLSELLFFDVRSQRGWHYSMAHAKPWLAGATLCYRKSAWYDNRFADIGTGEDNRFISRFAATDVQRLDDTSIFVGMIHGGNTSPKRLSAPSWSEISVDEIADVMGDQFDDYCRRQGNGWATSIGRNVDRARSVND